MIAAWEPVYNVQSYRQGRIKGTVINHTQSVEWAISAFGDRILTGGKILGEEILEVVKEVIQAEVDRIYTTGQYEPQPRKL